MMGPPAARDVTITGVTPTGERVRVRPIELSDPVWEMLYVKLDTDSDESVPPRDAAYPVRVFPRQLMIVQFGWGDEEDAVLFPWVVDPALSPPLGLDHDGPALRINGRVVSLDLGNKAAEAWLRTNREVPLDALRVILLSGEWAIDRPILEKLQGSGCVVGLGAYTGPLPAGLTEAVLACRPTGLVVDDGPSVAALLARADRLRHLLYAGDLPPRPARPEGLWTLMLLGTDAAADTTPAAVPLDWLADYRHLQVLSIGSSNGEIPCPDSYDALRSLAHLRSLVVHCPVNDDGLAVFSELRALEILALNAKDIHTLAPLADLNPLRRLALIGLPEDVSGLEVLEDLPELKAVLLDSETVKRKGAQIDRLRAARPDVIIQGFCLGSRWMVAIVAGGILGGVALRARRRRVSACAGR